MYKPVPSSSTECLATPAVVESLQQQAEARDAEGMEQATLRILCRYPSSNHRLGNGKNVDDTGSEADEQSESRTMPQRPWYFFFGCWGAFGAVVECRGEEMEQCGQRKRARQRASRGRLYGSSLAVSERNNNANLRHPASIVRRAEDREAQHRLRSHRSHGGLAAPGGA